MVQKSNSEKVEKPHSPKKRRKLFIILGSVILLLVIVRLILPYVVLHYANKTLSEMDGYYGHVKDVDLSIYRGAYTICDIYLNKVDSASGKQSQFFDSKLIDLSIEWGALLHGSIVGELVFETPRLKFIKENVEPKQLAADTTDFRELLSSFMPIKVNRVEIRNGVVEYIDEGSNPKVDVKLINTQLVATNLRNAYDKGELLPSTVTANAGLYEGTFDLNMKLNPLADRPTFDMNAELENTNLVLLNDFFQAYGKVDVNKGTFGLYAEVAAKEGKFKGYVKPIIKDLDVLGKEDRDDNLFRKIWEGIVGAAGQILKNPKEDQVATKVPLEGDISAPDVKTWTAIIEVLRNAFVHALFPAIEQQINITSVGKVDEEDKSLLQKVFEKDKPDDEKEKDKKEKHKKNKDKDK
ncbi:MAG: DUF748 domain-containing protein [Chitinophagales bacterium]